MNDDGRSPHHPPIAPDPVDASRMTRQPDIEMTLPTRPESVALVRQMVRGIFEVYAWPADLCADITIAVTEACTNAVLHAYPDRPGDATYEVVAWAATGRLEIAVRDAGMGINPRVPSESAGLGLGLPLMLAIGDEVAFRSEEDGTGTEVRMAFDIAVEPDVEGADVG